METRQDYIRKSVQLTSLQEEILEKVVAPAISPQFESHLYGHKTVAETVNFTELIKNLKRFYKSNGGNSLDWYKILLDSGF